jgi:hypothetical protein
MSETSGREWLTRRAYAVKYGVSRRTVWKWLDAGILESFRVGTLTRIRDLPPDQHKKSSDMNAQPCTTEHNPLATDPSDLAG